MPHPYKLVEKPKLLGGGGGAYLYELAVRQRGMDLPVPILVINLKSLHLHPILCILLLCLLTPPPRLTFFPNPCTYT
jgi:hypothetical protein